MDEPIRVREVGHERLVDRRHPWSLREILSPRPTIEALTDFDEVEPGTEVLIRYEAEFVREVTNTPLGITDSFSKFQDAMASGRRDTIDRTTTYTMTAKSRRGTNRDSVTIRVPSPPPDEPEVVLHTLFLKLVPDGASSIYLLDVQGAVLAAILLTGASRTIEEVGNGEAQRIKVVFDEKEVELARNETTREFTGKSVEGLWAANFVGPGRLQQELKLILTLRRAS